MTSAFESLTGPGKPLRTEPPDRKELAGLQRMGLARLQDAQLGGLAPESQFDLAYNAAHALCLAALRWHGYRSSNRFLVFNCCRSPWAWGRRCGACFPNATMRATWASTKAC